MEIPPQLISASVVSSSGSLLPAQPRPLLRSRRSGPTGDFSLVEDSDGTEPPSGTDPRLSNTSALLDSLQTPDPNVPLGLAEDFLAQLSEGGLSDARQGSTPLDSALGYAGQIGGTILGEVPGKSRAIGLLATMAIGGKATGTSLGEANDTPDLQALAIALDLTPAEASAVADFVSGLLMVAEAAPDSLDAIPPLDAQETAHQVAICAARIGQLAATGTASETDPASQTEAQTITDQAAELSLVATLLASGASLSEATESVAQLVEAGKVETSSEVISNYQAYLDHQYKLIDERFRERLVAPRDDLAPSDPDAPLSPLASKIQNVIGDLQEVARIVNALISAIENRLQPDNPPVIPSGGDAQAYFADLEYFLIDPWGSEPNLLQLQQTRNQVGVLSRQAFELQRALKVDGGLGDPELTAARQEIASALGTSSVALAHLSSLISLEANRVATGGSGVPDASPTSLSRLQQAQRLQPASSAAQLAAAGALFDQASGFLKSLPPTATSHGSAELRSAIEDLSGLVSALGGTPESSGNPDLTEQLVAGMGKLGFQGIDARTVEAAVQRMPVLIAGLSRVESSFHEAQQSVQPEHDLRTSQGPA